MSRVRRGRTGNRLEAKFRNLVEVYASGTNYTITVAALAIIVCFVILRWEAIFG